MKVKVEDLEGLLTQKYRIIVMKVKVEDLEGPQTSRSICFYYVRPSKCVTKEASNCHTNLIIYLFTLLQYILELTMIYNIYTHGQAILPRIRTFAAKPDHFRTTFIKKFRNWTKVRKIGP